MGYKKSVKKFAFLVYLDISRARTFIASAKVYFFWFFRFFCTSRKKKKKNFFFLL